MVWPLTLNTLSFVLSVSIVRIMLPLLLLTSRPMPPWSRTISGFLVKAHELCTLPIFWGGGRYAQRQGEANASFLDPSYTI